VPELSSKDPEDLYYDMSVSIGAFFFEGVATEKQQDIISDFEAAELDRDCKGMKKHLALLEKQKGVTDGDYVGLAKKHTKALRQRVNLVCPAGGARRRRSEAGRSEAAPETTGF